MGSNASPPHTHPSAAWDPLGFSPAGGGRFNVRQIRLWRARCWRRWAGVGDEKSKHQPPGPPPARSAGSPAPRAWHGAGSLPMRCNLSPAGGPLRCPGLSTPAPRSIACLPESGRRETARISSVKQPPRSGSREGTVSVCCRGGEAGISEKAPGMRMKTEPTPSPLALWPWLKASGWAHVCGVQDPGQAAPVLRVSGQV